MTNEEKVEPLAAIRQREQQGAQVLRDTRREAEDLIAAALRRADEIRDEAEETGRQAAEASYQEAMQEAAEEARRILADVNREIAAVQEAGEDHVARAVQFLMEAVLSST